MLYRKDGKINVLLITVISFVIYHLCNYLLGLSNLTLLWWIKRLAVILLSVGIVAGFAQIIHSISNEKKIRKIIFYILLILLVGFLIICNMFYIIFIANAETITSYFGVIMIKERRQVFKNNYINYYEYINPFVRSKQELIKEQFDDTISEDEYCGTTFYDEEGNEVDTFNGKTYIDFGTLKDKYSKEEYTFSEVNGLINKIITQYKENILEVVYQDEYFRIYLVNEEFYSEIDSNTRINNNNVIEDYILKEFQRDDSKYTIEFSNASITIINKSLEERNGK